jgi:formyltetrahydrofolate synthetase
VGTPIVQQIEAIATRIYGAAGIDLESQARKDLEKIEKLGLGTAPVCMAKTHLSLSADPKAVGAPVGFDLPVRDLRLAAGAGYVTVYAGAIATMPGLPSHAHFQDMDLTADGEVVGLT